MKSYSNTVIVKFKGGLGNQLYQYVMYKWIEMNYPQYRVLADLSDNILGMQHGGSELDVVFPKMQINKAKGLDYLCVTGKIPLVYGWVLKNKINAVRNLINMHLGREDKIYVNNDDNCSNELIDDKICQGYRFFDGFWQDATRVHEVLLKFGYNFAFEDNLYVNFDDEMLAENAVSIHIRRGDYVGSIFEKEVNQDYYHRAVEYVASRISNPHFYLFSDDKDYLKDNFCWIENKTIIYGNESKKSHLDMYMMSRFKNSILSNSTFSTWAAYLNKNDNPMIIYPDVEYMKNKSFSTWVGV